MRQAQQPRVLGEQVDDEWLAGIQSQAAPHGPAPKEPRFAVSPSHPTPTLPSSCSAAPSPHRVARVPPDMGRVRPQGSDPRAGRPRPTSQVLGQPWRVQQRANTTPLCPQGATRRVAGRTGTDSGGSSEVRVKTGMHTAPGGGGGVRAKARGTTLSKGAEVGMARWREKGPRAPGLCCFWWQMSRDSRQRRAQPGGQRSHNGQPSGKRGALPRCPKSNIKCQGVCLHLSSRVSGGGLQAYNQLLG